MDIVSGIPNEGVFIRESFLLGTTLIKLRWLSVIIDYLTLLGIVKLYLLSKDGCGATQNGIHRQF